ncbi:Diguanylate phosphodiesterase, predicted domain protein, partial [mine drainage metagenome]
MLEELHGLGIRLSIDDFGTGYSSLSYLKHIPFDTLKIDQSFVIGMLENRENLAIIESISSLAKIFGRNVVAEGMEQMSYSPMLMAMGCDLAQGYAISRPLPPERFLEWRQ